MSKERADISRILLRLQDEKYHNDQSIEKGAERVISQNEENKRAHEIQKDLILQRQEEMEREYLSLQNKYKDQIENIKVNTELELEKLQPRLTEAQNQKEEKRKYLESLRLQRTQLEIIVRSKEKTNDQLMTEYCYEKKNHNQQINEIAQKQ